MVRTPVYLLLFAASVLASRLFSKRSSDIFSKNLLGYAVYFGVTGMVSMLFLAILSGFSLKFNGMTALLALVNCMVAISCNVVFFAGYRLVGVGTTSVLNSSCGLLGSVLVGTLLFQEQLTGRNALRLLLMAAAVVLVFLDSQSQNHSKGKTRKLLALLGVAAALLAINCTVTAVSKFVAVHSENVDDNSYLFLDNAYLLGISLIVFAVRGTSAPQEGKKALKLAISPKIGFVVGNTVASSITSIATLLLLTQMDVMVYSPVSTALDLVMGMAAALLLREKPGPLHYCAAALACAAIFI